MTEYYRTPSHDDQLLIKAEIAEYAIDPANSIQQIQQFVDEKNRNLRVYVGKFDGKFYLDANVSVDYSNMPTFFDWLNAGIIVDGTDKDIAFDSFYRIAFTEEGDINKAGVYSVSVDVVDENSEEKNK